MVGLIVPLTGSLAAQSAGGAGGIETVASIEALLAMSGTDGQQVHVTPEGGTRTFYGLDSPAGGVWLRDSMCRKSDGSRYTGAIPVDGSGNDLDVYGGMTDYMTGWPKIGTYSIEDDHVAFDGVVYPAPATTSARLVLYLLMHAAPPASSAQSGIFGFLGSSTVGGTTYISGVKFTDGSSSPYPLGIGHYGASQALLGAGSHVTGRPIEALLDYSSDDAVSWVQGDGPRRGPQTKRTSILTGTNYFQVGALNSSVVAVAGFKVKRAVMITLT